MCGICGTFAYAPDASPVCCAALRRTRDAMRARGPDGEGLWISADRTIGLGHRRLAIIGLSPAGAQPMADDTGELQVVFNGEIYNYRSLRTELERKGYRFRSGADTEVLLYLYRECGAAMMDRLRGMYAFAIWDSRKRSLLLARDPFGMKPLYYADNCGVFRFASQVKALLTGGGIDTGADPAGHVGFFLWGHVPDPHTLYRGVRGLPAGSILEVDASGPGTVRSFCRITDVLAAAAGARSGPEPLRESLLDSVRHHLIADVPVGVFLSAGIDSSTLTALASEIIPGSLRTVTLGFEEFRDAPADETRVARSIARRYGTRHETRWLAAGRFQSDLAPLFAAMDQPSVDGLNTFLVSGAAAAAGWKVAISGIGGDELFGGYSNFTRIPRAVRLCAPLRRLPAAGRGFRWMASTLLKRLTPPKFASLLEYGGCYESAYLLSRSLFLPWELPRVLDPDLVRAGWRELQPLVSLHEATRGIGPGRLRISALEMNAYMRSQLLRDTDWAGMAHSLEVRVPLVDLELLRAVSSNRNGYTKAQMSAAPLPPLPAEVLRRRKTGFGVPMQGWLLSGNAKEPGSRAWARHVYRQFVH